MSTKSFIQSIAPAVQISAAGTGLFPSVIIAQAIQEGGAGKSQLATKYNNHFGIKAGSAWSGGRVRLDSNEVYKGVTAKQPSDFRVYPSREAGFADHIKFLQVNPRYAKAGVFTAATPEDQARALKKAGYATDPRYAENLIDRINENNLKQYDGPVDVKKKPCPVCGK